MSGLRESIKGMLSPVAEGMKTEAKDEGVGIVLDPVADHDWEAGYASDAWLVYLPNYDAIGRVLYDAQDDVWHFDWQGADDAPTDAGKISLGLAKELLQYKVGDDELKDETRKALESIMKESKDEVVDLMGATKKVLNNMVKFYEFAQDEAKKTMIAPDKYWAYMMSAIKTEAKISDYALLRAGVPVPMVMECLGEAEVAQPAYKTMTLTMKDGKTTSYPLDQVLPKIAPYAKQFKSPIEALVMGDPDAILKVIQKVFGANVAKWSVPAETESHMDFLSALVLSEMYRVGKFGKESAIIEKGDGWKTAGAGAGGYAGSAIGSVAGAALGGVAGGAAGALLGDPATGALAGAALGAKAGGAMAAKKGAEMGSGKGDAKARKGAGTGAAIGSLVGGPVGATVGGAIGRNVSKGESFRIKEGAVDALLDAFDKQDSTYLVSLFPHVHKEYPMQLVNEAQTVLNTLSADEMDRLWPNINREYLVNLKEDQLQELADRMTENCGMDHSKKKKRKRNIKAEGGKLAAVGATGGGILGKIAGTVAGGALGGIPGAIAGNIAGGAAGTAAGAAAGGSYQGKKEPVPAEKPAPGVKVVPAEV